MQAVLEIVLDNEEIPIQLDIWLGIFLFEFALGASLFSYSYSLLGYHFQTKRFEKHDIYNNLE